MIMEQLAIVIPLYNQLYYTRKLWKSIVSHEFKNIRFLHVMFVDNRSTDGTSEWLSKLTTENFAINKESNIRVYSVHAASNLGFGGGVNLGVEAVHSHISKDVDILVMNNDMELLPGCLDNLALAANGDENVGIIGGKLLFPDGVIQHAGAFLNKFGWGQHKGAGQLEANYVDDVKNTVQEYVTGALFYVTDRFIQTLPNINELFDPMYNPAFFEETHLCYTAWRSGFKVIYIHNAKAIHYENVTCNVLEKENEAFKKREISNINQIKFYKKQDDLGPFPSNKDCEHKVLISSKIYGGWSFASQMRNLALGLENNDVDVSIAPEEYHNVQDMQDWRIKRLILKDNDYWNRVVLRHSEGDHMYLIPPGLMRVAYVVGESNHVNNLWKNQLNHVDLILTPSTFYRGVLLNNGISTSVQVLSNSVDMEVFNYNVKPIPIKDSKRSLNFVSVFHFGERKGPDILLSAFFKAFDEKDDVSLTIHSPGIFGALGNAGFSVEEYVSKFKGNKRTAPVFITKGTIADNAMGGFLKNYDVMVLPTRAEGFGLPILEAAALGIPSIVTNYSGVLDIVDNNTGWTIDYKLVDIPLQILEYFKNYVGGQWAQPSVDHLVTLFRQIYMGSKKDIENKGYCAYKKSFGFSINNVGNKCKYLLFG